MAEDAELTENLTGTERAAILMMLLGEDEAAAEYELPGYLREVSTFHLFN